MNNSLIKIEPPDDEENEPSSPYQNQGSAGYRRGRALTELLKAVGQQELIFTDERTGIKYRISQQQALAKMVWDAAMTGSLTTIEAKRIPIPARDHLDLIKWIYNQIDGPARPGVDLSPDEIEMENERPKAITHDERVKQVSELVGELLERKRSNQDTRQSDGRGTGTTGPDSEEAGGTIIQFMAKGD